MKCKTLVACCEIIAENKKLKDEAKLGNIPYKEAIELQKENAKLKARLKEVEGRVSEKNILIIMDSLLYKGSLHIGGVMYGDDILRLAKQLNADILRKGEM